MAPGISRLGTHPRLEHAHLFTHTFSVPSVHVTGRRDTIVPIGESLLLAARFTQPIILEHAGGHVIPAEPAITIPIREFITSQAPAAAAPTADG